MTISEFQRTCKVGTEVTIIDQATGFEKYPIGIEEWGAEVMGINLRTDKNTFLNANGKHTAITTPRICVAVA